MDKITNKEMVNIYSKIDILARPTVETKPITGDFSELGGIYGWVVNRRIVYIGKTENFSKRMEVHVKELLRLKSKSQKYNSNLKVEDISIAILFETSEPNKELLSISEQVAIDACGGVTCLLNGRNEMSYIRLIERIRRD